MKSISGKELIKILDQHGWKLCRINGSHHILGKPGSILRLSVPVHGDTPLKLGLLKHLAKMASLEEGVLD